MKKILASLLVLAMVFAMVACSSQGSQTTAAPTANNETSAAAASENSTSDETRHKIGMIWYGNTDAMGGTFYAWANHAAELLNVDLVWHLGDFTTEAELAAAEQMITAGCEGIYFIPMDTAANLQVGNACMNGNVYWAISNRDILYGYPHLGCQLSAGKGHGQGSGRPGHQKGLHDLRRPQGCHDGGAEQRL